MRARSGQAILEISLMVPLLCLILFGIIDYGRALNSEQIMVDLTRQGSNMASRGTTLATAHKLGRHYLGVELSPEYADGIRRRLAELLSSATNGQAVPICSPCSST